MKVLIVNYHEVRDYLPMTEAVQVLEGAFKTLNQKKALNPLRSGMWLPDRRGLLAIMPGYLGSPEVMGIKTVSVFPGNDGTEYNSHQGSVMIYETQNGCPLAIIDGGEITAIRTAAASAVATKLLANEQASDLAILGSGVQAGTHLAAMTAVRNIRRVRVWSHTKNHAQRFADRESKQYGLPVEAVSSARSAVDGAELICTTTASKEPVLKGEWLSDGVHINAVGSSVPFTRELDTAAVVRSRLFVDRIESTVNEAGDYLFPKNEGAIDENHIQGEIGDILLKRIEGRRSKSEITLFKSLGLAIEDVACAYQIYQKLEKTGEGNWVELGGKKEV